MIIATCFASRQGTWTAGWCSRHLQVGSSGCGRTTKTPTSKTPTGNRLIYIWVHGPDITIGCPTPTTGRLLAEEPKRVLCVPVNLKARVFPLNWHEYAMLIVVCPHSNLIALTCHQTLSCWCVVTPRCSKKAYSCFHTASTASTMGRHHTPIAVLACYQIVGKQLIMFDSMR